MYYFEINQAKPQRIEWAYTNKKKSEAELMGCVQLGENEH
jgi:hypothetical protein